MRLLLRYLEPQGAGLGVSRNDGRSVVLETEAGQGGIVAGEIDAAVVHSYMTEAALAGAGEDRLDLAGVVYLCPGDGADAEVQHHGHDERNLAANIINQQVVHNCPEPTIE